MTDDAAPLLPQPETEEAYLALRGDPARWLPAMRVIARRHGLDADALYAERGGTHVIFRVGDEAWIKLVVPLWASDHRRERCALAACRDHPDIPVPPLLADGEIEGWPYLVMGTVPGRSVVLVWRELPRTAQVDLAAQVGALMARLHAIDSAGLPALAHDWEGFVRRQREGCVARHAEAGADRRWQAEIARYLDDAPPLEAPDTPPVMLHADVTDEHLLVAERGGRWHVTGLVDFADAMLGRPLYEFAAPAVFLTQRRPWAQRAMLRGYGFEEADLGDELARRLTTYALLHRYGRLPQFLRLCPDPKPTSMREVQRALFDL